MAPRSSILVADDEGLARSGIVELLQDEGYQVYEAAGGPTALQILDEVDVDIVRTDVKIPGAELYRKLEDILISP